MQTAEKIRIIKVLKVLLTIDDPEIIKFTIESLIEDLEDSTPHKKDSK